MCEACANGGGVFGVNLTRKGPKNKGKTPEEWLIGHDLQEGYYDIYDYAPVYDDDENVVGRIVEYEGSRMREYSQGAFTLKPANDECGQCEHIPVSEHHMPVKYAHQGCQCGNIAYASRKCFEHPLPSLESRWIRLNQAGDCFCNHCDTRLAQENWSAEHRNYCNAKCQADWKAAYEKRMAEWKLRRGM